jgi:hypothetical protein
MSKQRIGELTIEEANKEPRPYNVIGCYPGNEEFPANIIVEYLDTEVEATVPDLAVRISELGKECAKLKAALKYYADQFTYSSGPLGDEESLISKDRGAIARVVLEGGE